MLNSTELPVEERSEERPWVIKVKRTATGSRVCRTVGGVS
jgi:hypothetical protein